MKKIICFLLCAVMLCALCACGNDDAELPAAETPGVQMPATGSDLPTREQLEAWAEEARQTTITPAPEELPDTGREETVVLTRTDADGKTASMPCVLRRGVFAGGPALSLYGEQDGGWSETSEGYLLTGSGSEACGLDLRFVQGKSAEELAPGYLDGFDEIKSLEDLGTVIIAGRGARHVRGSSENYFWEAWLIDQPKGTVALTIYAEPQAEDAVLRLEGCAGTLELKSSD